MGLKDSAEESRRSGFAWTISPVRSRPRYMARCATQAFERSFGTTRRQHRNYISWLATAGSWVRRSNRIGSSLVPEGVLVIIPTSGVFLNRASDGIL